MAPTRPSQEPALPVAPSCSHRGPVDDFICLRFRVWYPSFDCAVRTRYRTCNGCLDCEQGRFNLKRHAAAVEQLRVAWPRVDD